MSTISYNTEDFLIEKLNYMLDHNIIDFWAYIYHYKEEDEEKDHIHLYVVPSQLIDSNQFNREFVEFVEGEKLPRKNRPWVPSSKFDHWFLYIIHHAGYLASKGQSRKYHYSIDDVMRSDSVYLLDKVHQIDWTKINPLGSVIEAAKSGISFAEFLQKSNLNILQVRSAQFVFEQVQGGQLNRNGRLTHTPKE